MNQTIPVSGEVYKKSREMFFSPWTDKGLKTTKEQAMKRAKTRLDNYISGKAVSYGENLMPRDKSWYWSMYDNLNLSEYGKVKKPAIALKNTSLRGVPTVFPDFNPKLPKLWAL